MLPASVPAFAKAGTDAIIHEINPYIHIQSIFYIYLYLSAQIPMRPAAVRASVRRGLAADAHNSECVRAIGGFEPIRCIKQLLVQLIRAKAGTVSHDGQPVA